MKKLPLILILLILASVSVNTQVGVSADAETQTNPAVSADLASQIDLAPRVDSAMEDQPAFVTNAVDERVKFFSINPSTGEIKIAIEAVDAELYPRRIQLVMYNYEDALSEEEADARAAKLGEKRYEKWGTKVVELKADDYEHQLELTLDSEIQLDELNKADLVYYAVQFGERRVADSGETQWAKTQWVRGKVDYWSCVHADNYRTGKVCEAVETGVGQVNYWADGVESPASYYPNWHFEWRDILRQRLINYNQQVTELMYIPGWPTSDLAVQRGAELHMRLKIMEQNLLKAPYTVVDDVIAWRDDVERQLHENGFVSTAEQENWLPVHLGVDEDDTDNYPNDWSTDETGSDKNQGDGDSGNSKGDKNQGDDDSGNSIGKNSDETLQNDLSETLQDVIGQVTQAVATVNPTPNVVTVATGANNLESQTDSNNEDNTKNSQNAENVKITTENADQTEVKVPATGGEQKWQIWDFWWVLIPIFGLLVLLLLWLKRAFDRDEE